MINNYILLYVLLFCFYCINHIIIDLLLPVETKMKNINTQKPPTLFATNKNTYNISNRYVNTYVGIDRKKQ